MTYLGELSIIIINETMINDYNPIRRFDRIIIYYQHHGHKKSEPN